MRYGGIYFTGRAGFVLALWNISRSVWPQRIRAYSTGLAACLGFFIASPTKAASLQLVTADWGTNGVPSTVSIGYLPI